MKRKILVLFIIMILVAAIAYVVYATEKDPGHAASEIGGDDAADRKFATDGEYEFQKGLYIKDTSGLSSNYALKVESESIVDGIAVDVRVDKAKENTNDLAIYAYSGSSKGVGLFAFVDNIADSNFGVIGQSNSPKGIGIKGVASPTATTGSFATGVYGSTTGQFGTGVYGLASSTAAGINTGVYGEGKAEEGVGVRGEAPGSKGIGVYGEATSLVVTTASYGVFGTTNAGAGAGVHGANNGNGGPGVTGEGGSSGCDFKAVTKKSSDQHNYCFDSHGTAGNTCYIFTALNDCPGGSVRLHAGAIDSNVLCFSCGTLLIS